MSRQRAGRSPLAGRCGVYWARAVGLWLVIALVETLHGLLRQWLLVPRIGEAASRQLGVAIGSLLILAIALVGIRWLGARTLAQQCRVGLLWVLLTLAFEIGLSLSLGDAPGRLADDYVPARGGFMGLGLLFMALCPAIAARWRGLR